MAEDEKTCPVADISERWEERLPGDTCPDCEGEEQPVCPTCHGTGKVLEK